jgi:putative N6-adenine-specific DNA methylase
VTAPGLEKVTADELAALGITPGEIAPGGVAFTAVDDEKLFTANLWLRSASRVIVRIAEFKVTAFHELERAARGVPWADFVPAGGSVRLRVTCKKSKLYHSDAVAERIEKSIVKAVPGAIVAGAAAATAAAGDDEDTDAHSDENAAQLFVIRLLHNVCTVSVDSSGALLHRRGYRLATAKAPMRETLAAGILLALRWDGSAPLIDPMCGSGTIAIEAALIARHMAPGQHRTFACERWPGAPVARFAKLRAGALAKVLPRSPVPLLASDRDAGAIAAAAANAERAGVAGDITLRRLPLSAFEPPAGPGLVLVNPPYGARIGEAAPLKNLYAQLGNVVKLKVAGWTVAMCSAERSLEAQVKLPFREVLRIRNGGIPVRIVSGQVPVRD